MSEIKPEDLEPQEQVDYGPLFARARLNASIRIQELDECVESSSVQSVLRVLKSMAISEDILEPECRQSQKP